MAALTLVPEEPLDHCYARDRPNPVALRVKLADLQDNLDPPRLTRVDEETRQRLLVKYEHSAVALSE